MWCMNEYKKSLTILTTNIVVDIVVGLVNGGSFIIVCGVLFFFFSKSIRIRGGCNLTESV